MQNETKLVHAYYGDGKGKTTAALGLAVRAAGRGKSVVIVQFLKGRQTGELAALARLPNVMVLRGQAGGRFVRQMTAQEREATRALHDDNMKKALALIADGACDVLVLDEALDALALNMLDDAPLRALLKSSPLPAEVVITGHAPIEWIFERADYVTEMRKRKHPYDGGIAAREGIEF